MGAPRKHRETLMADPTASLPPVSGMDVDGRDDVPMFKRCLVLSLDETEIGLVLMTDAPEGESPRAKAVIIMKLDGAKTLIESIGTAMRACAARQRKRPTKLDG